MKKILDLNRQPGVPLEQWNDQEAAERERRRRAASEPRMVRLHLCTRRTCQKVFPDDEMVWVRAGLRHDGTCPGCGCKVHYSLHPDGRIRKIGEDFTPFDLATLPGIPVHPKAGKRVREGIAALVQRGIKGTPEFQCCFAAAAGSPVPRCTKPATRKWGGVWFCDEHGSRSMPVAPAEKKPAGPEWVASLSAPDIWHLDTATIQLTVARRGTVWMAKDSPVQHPTKEAAQQAAVARAIELVEGTLAILKP